jgi:hypothetical protein
MSLANIRSAFVTAVKASSVTGTLHFAENIVFEANTLPCNIFHFIPGVRSVGSLGKGGLDRVTGIIQIDLRETLGKGVSNLLARQQTLCNYFVAGRSFTYSTTTVWVNNFSVTQVKTEKDFAVSYVTIAWEAHLARTTF